MIFCHFHELFHERLHQKLTDDILMVLSPADERVEVTGVRHYDART